MLPLLSALVLFHSFALGLPPPQPASPGSITLAESRNERDTLARVSITQTLEQPARDEHDSLLVPLEFHHPLRDCQDCGAYVDQAFDIQVAVASVDPVDCSATVTLGTTVVRLAGSGAEATVVHVSHDRALELAIGSVCAADDSAASDSEASLYLTVAVLSISGQQVEDHHLRAILTLTPESVETVEYFDDSFAVQSSVSSAPVSSVAPAGSVHASQDLALTTEHIASHQKSISALAQNSVDIAVASAGLSQRPILDDIREEAHALGSCTLHTAGRLLHGALTSLSKRAEIQSTHQSASSFLARVQGALAMMKEKYGCGDEKTPLLGSVYSDDFEDSTDSVQPAPSAASVVDQVQDDNTDVVVPPQITSPKIILADVPTPLIRALEVLAAAIGVGGLLALIRRRFGSLRRRVERLADREERIKAREYRRAARKEAWRRRYQSIRCTFLGCFVGGCDRAIADEEKAGLANNAAPYATDEDCEDVQFAISHMDGLRYVHQVAAELARQGRLPEMSQTAPRLSEARSRTSSSLPSYESDILPGYATDPDSDLERAFRVVDGFRRANRRSGTPTNASTTTGGGSSRYTPYSSVPALSPRHSRETIRTDYSAISGAS